MPTLARSSSDWKPLWLVWMAVAPLLVPDTSHAAATCAEVRAQDPGASDGTYSLNLGGQQVSVYCRDMTGTPKEFLTLPHTGSATNYSYYGQGQNTSSVGQTTWFSKVLLDPAALTLVMDDFTFSTSEGWLRFSDQYVYNRALGGAADCVGDYSASGRSNIDLTGTPFDIVPGQFQVNGKGSVGSATFSGTQIVNLVGGGYCGGIGVTDDRLRVNLRNPLEPTPELVHSYSFTTSAADSVSGAHGSLEGGATISNGEVVLNGVSADVSLPIGGTIAHLQDATFEAWVKWGALAQKTQATLFYFGNDKDAAVHLLTAQGGTPLFIITTAEHKVIVAPSNRTLPEEEFTHVAVTIDHTAGLIRLYVNGLEWARKATKLTPSELGATSNNWLGYALHENERFFKGSISEFRIHRTALSPSNIAAHFAARDTFRTLETGFSARPANPSNKDTAPFVFNATGLYVRYLCSMDESTFQPCTSPFTPPSLADGSHTFRVQARDSLGNVEASPNTYSWRVDKTPPETSFASTPPPASRQRVPSFSFASSEPRSSFECSLDLAPFSECPGVFPELDDGEHQLSVRARDEAHNLDPAPARYSWIVDNGVPQEPSLQRPAPGQTLFEQRPQFVGTAEPEATVTFLVDGAEAGSAQADAQGVWRGQSASALPWGEHRISATATDRAGNTSPLLAEVPFLTSQRSAYGCSASPSSWQGSWPWALLLLGLLRRNSRPSHGRPFH